MRRAQSQSGGHSSLDPRLPIPNRTVKRVCADDSVHSHAKVGYRQAIFERKGPASQEDRAFLLTARRALSRPALGAGSTPE